MSRPWTRPLSATLRETLAEIEREGDHLARAKAAQELVATLEYATAEARDIRDEGIRCDHEHHSTPIAEVMARLTVSRSLVVNARRMTYREYVAGRKRKRVTSR